MVARIKSWSVWLLFYAGVLCVLFYGVRPVSVPSMSMFPTFSTGAWLLVDEWSFHGHRVVSLDPNDRGRIVVFRAPHQEGVRYVKRIIAIAGDRIQMRHGVVWLNGHSVPQDDCGLRLFFKQTDAVIPVGVCREVLGQYTYDIVHWPGVEASFDDSVEYIVPKDHVFVLGDNRSDSADSRVPYSLGGVEMVPVSSLEGWSIAVLYRGFGRITEVR